MYTRKLRNTHHRFFNFAPTSPDDFKMLLEDAVGTYDRANDGAAYTPYASFFVITVFGAAASLLTNMTNDQPYASMVNALQITIPVIAAISPMVIRICKKIADGAEKDVKRLIEEGVDSKYFNSNPNFIPDDKDADKLELMEGAAQTDDLRYGATVEHILGRKPK